MLRRDPSGSDVLSALGRAHTPSTPAPEERRSLFVGPHRELGILRAADDDVQRGRTQIVLVGGRSGMGKTALLDSADEAALH